MRRGNHLTVQLRDHETGNCKNIKLADLPLFQDFDVVIWTGGETLRGFAPLCSNKLELGLFLQNLADYGNQKDYALDRIKSDMAALARDHIQRPSRSVIWLEYRHALSTHL